MVRKAERKGEGEKRETDGEETEGEGGDWDICQEAIGRRRERERERERTG